MSALLKRIILAWLTLVSFPIYSVNNGSLAALASVEKNEANFIPDQNAICPMLALGWRLGIVPNETAIQLCQKEKMDCE